MLKGAMQQMSDWIHAYMSNQDGLDSINSDVRVHSVFYSVCQGLFYVIAFRHRDLLSRKKSKLICYSHAFLILYTISLQILYLWKV